MKDRDYEVTTFRDNGTFASGPIQNGTWSKVGKKFTAAISQADVQRVVDQLNGGPGINVTSTRRTTYKLKEDDKGPHKTGKLKFSIEDACPHQHPLRGPLRRPPGHQGEVLRARTAVA